MGKIRLTAQELKTLEEDGSLTKRIEITEATITGEGIGPSSFINLPDGYEVKEDEMSQDLDSEVDPDTGVPFHSEYKLYQDFIIFDPSRHERQ